MALHAKLDKSTISHLALLIRSAPEPGCRHDMTLWQLLAAARCSGGVGPEARLTKGMTGCRALLRQNGARCAADKGNDWLLRAAQAAWGQRRG